MLEKRCCFCGKNLIAKDNKLSSLNKKKFCNEDCKEAFNKFSMEFDPDTKIQIDNTNFEIRKEIIQSAPFGLHFKGLTNDEIKFFIVLNSYTKPDECYFGKMFNSIVPDAIFIYNKKKRIIAIEFEKNPNQRTITKYKLFPLLVDELWIFGKLVKDTNILLPFQIKFFKSFGEFGVKLIEEN